MGKNSKEHRKRVAKRNQRIKQTQTSFKQIELEKQRIAENGGTPPPTVNPELEEGDMS